MVMLYFIIHWIQVTQTYCHEIFGGGIGSFIKNLATSDGNILSWEIVAKFKVKGISHPEYHLRNKKLATRDGNILSWDVVAKFKVIGMPHH